MELRQLFDKGLTAHRAGNLVQAEKLYRQLLRADAHCVPALHMLGFLKAQQARYDEALVLLGKAVKQKPDDIDLRNHHAHAFLAAKRYDEALAAYDRVLAVQPGNFEALYNRGVALNHLLRFDEALTALDAALALKPDTVTAHHNRAVALVVLERHREAMESYDRALALDPANFPSQANRAMVTLNLCDWARVARTPLDALASVAPPLTLMGYSDDKALQLKCAQAATRNLIPQPVRSLWRGEKYRHDRIRLAYVSADFRDHAVAFQLAPLIDRHDRDHFQVIGISTGLSDNSAMRDRLAKAFDRFHDFASLNSDEIARRMHEMEVDIAVDLGGHTAQSRLQIFAHRPAPVQVSWLGYPGTTGADFIDYLIADATVAPLEDQVFFTEKLVHLPHTYFPVDPDRVIGVPPSRADCGLPADGFVFCAFNYNWKITQPMFDIWMRLLAAVPESVLWLKQPVPDARVQLEQEATARGIDPARLVYADTVPIDIHLARHQLAGIFLDTLPYGAHATAADALGAGLPVLTCRGKAFSGRVAASLLEAVELPELIAESLEEYETKALALARDPTALARLKQKLKEKLGSAPLFDADGFRRAIETAFTAMHGNSG